MMSLISDARQINISDCSYLRKAFHGFNKDSWVYFSPFLFAYSLPPRRSVYILKESGSTIIFQYLRRQKMDRIDLLIPPLPLNNRSFKWISRLTREVKLEEAQKELRILWVDDSDKKLLGKYFKDHIYFEVRDEEYIYSPSDVWQASGGKFRDFRKKIHRASNMLPVFRKMTPEDVGDANSLLKDWRRKQGRRNGFLLDWGYTRSILSTFFKFKEEDLSAWCVEIEGKLKAFAMAGPISSDMACFFIAKSDPSFSGLSEYQRWRVCGELSEYGFVNDAGDLGIDGLKRHKSKLRPVRYNMVHSATITM